MRNDIHLAPRPANHRPLTPLDFLLRSAEAHAERPAVAWRGRSWSYRQFAGLVVRLAARLAAQGVQAGHIVSVMAGNRPEMLAAHFAVPMLGAVLNTVNTRLDADTVGYILGHSESSLVLSDPDCLAVAKTAAETTGIPCLTFMDGDTAPGSGKDIDILVDDGITRPLDLAAVTDEWQPICLNYTSGTTGRPKGVVYHHRGAYLNALGNAVSLGLTPRSVYLWTLPMFHCNGWCHTWAVTAAGGLHVCLDRIDPALIFREIEEHRVTHMSCAPVVLYMLLDHPARAKRQIARRVTIATGGAAPTSTLIEQLDQLGFDLIHLYGLTESYGPATIHDLSEEERALPPAEKAVKLARQGIRHLTAGRVHIVDEAGRELPADGRSMGEIVLVGNTLMAGYYRDPEATAAAFHGGAFHTGDLAVRHPDGNIEIRDRSKDIIISGGENISSLEVENVLHQHPAVLLAAVVAAPDPKWGEVPCAYLETRQDATVTTDDLRAFCRAHLAGYKIPRRFVIGELPKTATGKIKKFVLRQYAAG
ncbi:AMP-binding protein (plasmid) [Aminobacter sp. UC22_36]|uniref:AMP-binding protein n=1 Tax=Aminobacter sp. UC22_36 TaxID=3374549 RepID=UPI003756D0CF